MDTTEPLSLCASQTWTGVWAQRRGCEDELSPGEASCARVEIALDTHSNRPGPRLPIYTTSITKLSKINLQEVWIYRWLSALQDFVLQEDWSQTPYGQDGLPLIE